MKLYDLPRNTHFKLDGETYLFDHVDGMYSVCYTLKKEIFHLAAWTEVEQIEGTNI